jgi:MEDS: MEthanogen/methylotroph, DcmR Sensory domain
MSWTTFLEAAPAAGHAVQIYDDLDELTGSVGRFLAAGFQAGEPAIIIPAEDHREAFARELESRGWDADRLQRQGLLTCLDADTTLAALLEEEGPSPDRFEQVVGGAVDAVARRHPEKTIRAFGEMVDLLWRLGRNRDAIALEELWNRLAETRRFALLCGYRLDIFDVRVQADALPEIFRVHTHPRPAADTSRLADAVDKALTEIVGPVDAGQIYLEVAQRVPRSSLPRAEVVLMWLSEQATPTATEILDRARMHYVKSRAPRARRSPVAAG